MKRLNFSLNDLDKKRFQNLSSSNIFKKENYIPLTMFSMTFDRQVNPQFNIAYDSNRGSLPDFVVLDFEDRTVF